MKLSLQRIAEIETVAKPIREGAFRNSKEKCFWGGNHWLSISSWVETPDRSWPGDKELFKKICNLLRRNGWDVTVDPNIDEHYPILNKKHRMASKGELQMLLEYYPAGMKLDIFPIYNDENRNGPRYGFKKYECMNYQDKKRTDLILSKIKNYLLKNGLKNHVEPEFSCPREEIEFRMRKCWHFKECDTNSGAPAEKASYNTQDRDKRPLTNGQEKYFWDYNGKLLRGTIYYNINNMWWVLAGGEVRNICCSDFFDADSPHFGKSKSDRKKLHALAREIKKAVAAGNEKKEELLRNLLWKERGHLPEEERYVIQCIEHEDKKVLWWDENSSGYTENIKHAGRYTLKEATSICCNDRQEKMFKLSEYHLAKPGKESGKKKDKRYRRQSA